MVTPLHDIDPLVQLHRKFWLQSMQDVPENESMNIDKDEEVDEDEGEGDETGPGCHKLSICIPSIWPELWYLELHRDKHKAPSVVVTGQPGIGKSYWLLYALCRRLTEGKPVIWFHSARRYLFVKEGVFVISSDYPSSGFKTRIWTFIDADDSRDGIPDYLAPQMTNHLIILSSPPHRARWVSLTKTTLCSIVIMNPWTREEISKAAVVYGLEANDPRIDEMYNQYGPTPRICLEFLCDRAFINAYQVRYRSALATVSLKKLSDMANDKMNFPIDGESDTLVLVRRLPSLDGNLSDGRLEPITYTVKLALRNQLRKEARAARIALYKSLANVEGTRHIAGVVYESLAQELLEKKIALKLVPMVQRGSSGSGRGKGLPRWDSNHGDDADPSLVRLIDITPAETFIYPGSGLDHPIKDKVYYAPEAENQVAIDSFIMAEGKLYIFQSTIGFGSDHPIRKEIVPFFSKMVPGALPPRADWHFVLVVPPSVSEISCSQLQNDDDLKELLAEMNLFSAVLDCEAE
ncbi:hypothetical protein H4582DRAFT_2109937 [Lactarius indigo]|nr:hypothetical protein H4582DRAFT_2109937 [Lactarius indigo]